MRLGRLYFGGLVTFPEAKMLRQVTYSKGRYCTKIPPKRKEVVGRI